MKAYAVKTELTSGEMTSLTSISKKGDEKTMKKLEDMTMKELVDLHNKHADAKVKNFQTKAVAVRRTMALLKEKGVSPAQEMKETKTRTKKSGKEPRATLAGAVRNLFDGKKSVKKADIAKATGLDDHHVSLLMGRLKRRKVHALVTQFNSDTEAYEVKEK